MGKRSTREATASPGASPVEGAPDRVHDAPPDDAGVIDALPDHRRAELLAGLAAGAAAIGALVVPSDQLHPGDLPIMVGGTTIGGIRVTGLGGALDRLFDQVEREIGGPVEALDRAGKQAVVHRLDQLGAFNLRKAVEDIADRLHVSRFTVYNYLNSQS